MKFRILLLIIPWTFLGLVNGLGVKLYDRRNREGDYLRLEIKGCTNVPLHWDNQASSVDSEGECVLFYENEKCGGRQVALKSFHAEYQLNLAHENIGFSDVISSASPCGKALTGGRYVIQNSNDGSILTAGKAGVVRTSPWRPFIQIKKNSMWGINKSFNKFDIVPEENQEDNPMTFDTNTLYEYDKETKVYQKTDFPAKVQWEIESAYRGKYRIRNVQTRKCLVKERKSDGVSEQDCDIYTPRQEWVFRSIPDPSKKSSILSLKPPPPPLPPKNKKNKDKGQEDSKKKGRKGSKKGKKKNKSKERRRKNKNKEQEEERRRLQPPRPPTHSNFNSPSGRY